MIVNVELVNTAPLISEIEMRKFGVIPVIRGYVKSEYPPVKHNGLGEVVLRIKGPIDALDVVRNVDVYETPKGRLLGYVQLSDGTFVGLTKERVNKKALGVAVTVGAIVIGGIVVVNKMDEEDKQEILREIKKLRKQIQK